MSIEKQLDYVNNLNSKQKESIQWYTNKNFESFNYSLRNDSELLDVEKYYLNNIDSAFANSPPLEESITVYRGRKKDILTKDKAFVSTSMNFRIALVHFAGLDCCVFQITVPAGSKILAIEQISDFSSEEEVLLPRNCDFIISGAIVKDRMKIIYATLIPPKSIISSDLDEFNIDSDIFDENMILDYIEKYIDRNLGPKLLKEHMEKLYEQITGEGLNKAFLRKIQKRTKLALDLEYYSEEILGKNSEKFLHDLIDIRKEESGVIFCFVSTNAIDILPIVNHVKDEIRKESNVSIVYKNIDDIYTNKHPGKLYIFTNCTFEDENKIVKLQYWSAKHNYILHLYKIRLIINGR